MDWKERISINPKVLVGKPVIKGTRIAVEFLVELLAEGWTHAQILQNYPHLTEADIQAALHYASEMMKQEKVYPLTLRAVQNLRRWRGPGCVRGRRIPTPPSAPLRGRDGDIGRP